MPHIFAPGDSAYILNSHRTRAHAARVLSVGTVAGKTTVVAFNTDTSQGPLAFDAVDGWPTDPAYQYSGVLPARLVPADDPEALRLREVTAGLRSSTLHYDEVVEAAANLKRNHTAGTWDALLAAVEAWGDDLGVDW